MKKKKKKRRRKRKKKEGGERGEMREGEIKTLGCSGVPPTPTTQLPIPYSVIAPTAAGGDPLCGPLFVWNPV